MQNKHGGRGLRLNNVSYPLQEKNNNQTYKFDTSKRYYLCNIEMPIFNNIQNQMNYVITSMRKYFIGMAI